MTARKKYSKEFKLDAISLVVEQKYTQTEAARSLGCPFTSAIRNAHGNVTQMRTLIALFDNTSPKRQIYHPIPKNDQVRSQLN
jgi:transposase-like protein